MGLDKEEAEELAALEAELAELERKHAALHSESSPCSGDLETPQSDSPTITVLKVEEALVDTAKEAQALEQAPEEDDIISFDMSGVCKENCAREASKKRPRDDCSAKLLEEAVARIAAELKEPNHHILRAVVSHIGAEDALEMLADTHAIEKRGGMMTADRSRRRTPGSVYLQLARKTMGSSIFSNICTKDARRRKGGSHVQSRKRQKRV